VSVGFSCGDVVVLVGLSKAEFNHHVGRIVTELSDSGRHGVCLHSEQSGHPPISLKPGNLLHIPKRVLGQPVMSMHRGAAALSGQTVNVVDSIGTRTISMLLSERGVGLPDTAVDNVLEFLLIHRVSMKEVSVTGCSSSRGDFPLASVLNEAQDEWWISAPGSMPGGLGCEYLEFAFGPRPRRVEIVALRIPPMPYGPLSVRIFCVKVMGPTGEWLTASPQLETLDRAALQEFALLPPVDTVAMRIECTRNAAVGTREGRITDCIGLFQVSFS